jgi:hypothetical protein
MFVDVTAAPKLVSIVLVCGGKPVFTANAESPGACTRRSACMTRLSPHGTTNLLEGVITSSPETLGGKTEATLRDWP